MHRHFCLLGESYEIHRAHYEPPLPGETHYTQLAPLRFFQRLVHSRLHRHAIGLDLAFGVFHSQRRLRAILQRVRPAAVITVAEGSLFAAVRAVATKARVPLVSIFHDWAPGWFNLPRAYQPGAERTFRRLYADSATAFFVSEEMGVALGPKPGASLLYPIPDCRPAGEEPQDAPPDRAFHALYAGTFRFLYAPEIKALCRALVFTGKTHLLRLTGPDPQWTGADAELLGTGGMYRGFLDRAALRDEFQAAPAQLVVSSFEPSFELYSRYSFPSKIPEYCQFGRPLLLWGPEFSAAVRWARRSRAAWVVTDPDPAAVIAAIEHLAATPALRAELAARARQSAANEFNPSRLQEIFQTGLQRAITLAQADGLPA